MSCEEVFLEKLRQSGFRLTPQREMVLSVMHRIERSATAEDIHARVQERSSSVDISTVYRTLELLQQFQLVSAVELADGLRHYELLGVHGPHLHLACTRCGKLLGIELHEADALHDQLLAEYGFDMELDHVTIPGLCRECRISAARSADGTDGH